MASMNHSTVVSGISLSSPDASKTTWHRTAVLIAAWVEILVGASFLLVPYAQSQMVFAATPEGTGSLFARLAGIGLMALGIACLPTKFAGVNPNAVRSLFLFNIAATILFAWIGVATSFRGVVLWPVVILHALLAIALAPALKQPA